MRPIFYFQYHFTENIRFLQSCIRFILQCVIEQIKKAFMVQNDRFIMKEDTQTTKTAVSLKNSTANSYPPSQGKNNSWLQNEINSLYILFNLFYWQSIISLRCSQPYNLVIHLPPLKQVSLFPARSDGGGVGPGLREHKQVILIQIEFKLPQLRSHSVEEPDPHDASANLLQLQGDFAALAEEVLSEGDDEDVGAFELALLEVDEGDAFTEELLEVLLVRLEAEGDDIEVGEVLHNEFLVLRCRYLPLGEGSQQHPQLLRGVPAFHFSEADIIKGQQSFLHVFVVQNLLDDDAVTAFVRKDSQEGRLHSDLIDFVQVRLQLQGLHLSADEKFVLLLAAPCSEDGDAVPAEARLEPAEVGDTAGGLVLDFGPLDVEAVDEVGEVLDGLLGGLAVDCPDHYLVVPAQQRDRALLQRGDLREIDQPVVPQHNHQRQVMVVHVVLHQLELPRPPPPPVLLPCAILTRLALILGADGVGGNHLHLDFLLVLGEVGEVGVAPELLFLAGCESLPLLLETIGPNVCSHLCWLCVKLHELTLIQQCRLLLGAFETSFLTDMPAVAVE